jgi:hypothetical protein
MRQSRCFRVICTAHTEPILWTLHGTETMKCAFDALWCTNKIAVYAIPYIIHVVAFIFKTGYIHLHLSYSMIYRFLNCWSTQQAVLLQPRTQALKKNANYSVRRSKICWFKVPLFSWLILYKLVDDFPLSEYFPGFSIMLRHSNYYNRKISKGILFLGKWSWTFRRGPLEINHIVKIWMPFQLHICMLNRGAWNIDECIY